MRAGGTPGRKGRVCAMGSERLNNEKRSVDIQDVNKAAEAERRFSCLRLVNTSFTGVKVYVK